MEKKMERRNFLADVSITGNKIMGYGVLFDTESRNLGGFIEKIDKNAFKNVDFSEVRALRDHKPELLLGTVVGGTLKLTVDSRGVKYEIDVPNTTAGRDTLEYVKRGDMNGSSFSFAAKEHQLSRRSDGVIERVVTEIRAIDDIGPVTRAAYKDTSTYARDAEVVEKEMETIEKEMEAKETKTEKVEKIEEKPVEEVKPLPGLSVTDKVKLKRLRG